MTSTAFALILGIAYLGAGVLGMVPAMLMPPPPDAPATSFTLMYGYLLGLFPVNIVHSALHVAIGLWGIAAANGNASARVYARSLAVLYGALAVMGLIPGLHTVFGLIPIHGHDVWLHGATAAAAAYFGWRGQAAAHDRRSTTDRRQGLAPIARERRLRMIDRRRGYGDMHPA